MALQYNLDKGPALGSFADFVHAQNYSDAFEHALLNSNPDQTGKVGQVDILNLDLYGENFRAKGYDAAYISTYDAADETDQTALDKARIILFDKSLDEGVSVDLNGEKAHFIGTGAGDDEVFVGGKYAQTIDVGDGADVVQTGRGDDLIFAGEGDDVVHSGRGDDTIYGEGGADKLFGERGDDSIIGGGGDATIDGGSGFDVAVVDGEKADFTFVGHEWVNSVTGDHIANVEYTQLSDDSVLITVENDNQAALARLFQAVNDQDPTAADYKSALVALNNGASLESLAKNLVDGLDDNQDLPSGPLTDAGDKKVFVEQVIENMFDGTPGAWTDGEINAYVSSLPNWSKAKIVADLVTKISAADDHIGIHIDTTH